MIAVTPGPHGPVSATPLPICGCTHACARPLQNRRCILQKLEKLKLFQFLKRFLSDCILKIVCWFNGIWFCSFPLMEKNQKTKAARKKLQVF